MERSASINATSFNTPSKRDHRMRWGEFVTRYGRRAQRFDWKVLCLPSIRHEEIDIYRHLHVRPKNIIGVEQHDAIFRQMQVRHRGIRLYHGRLSSFVGQWISGEGSERGDPWFQVANGDFSSPLFHNLDDAARLMLVLDPRACLSVCATASHDYQTPLMGIMFQSLFGELIGVETILAFKTAWYSEALALGLVTPNERGEIPQEQRIIVDNSFLRELAFLWVVALGLLCHPYRDFRFAPDFSSSLKRMDRLLSLTKRIARFSESATRRARDAQRRHLKGRGNYVVLGLVDRDIIETIVDSREWQRLIGEPRVYLAPYAARRIKYASRNTLVESWFLKFTNGSSSLSWSFVDVLRQLVEVFQKTRVEFIELEARRTYAPNERGVRP